MQGLNRVGRFTGAVVDEQARYLDELAALAARPQLVAREIFPVVRRGDPGTIEWRFWTITDASQAQISIWDSSSNKDKISKTPTTITVPVISKDTELFQREIDAGRGVGGDLVADTIQNLARQVAEEEDKLLLSGQYTGWEALGIQGLSTRTSRNTEASAGAWPANCLTDLKDAMDELITDGHRGPYALVVPESGSGFYSGLFTQISNTTITYAAFILNNMPIRTILPSTSLFASSGAQTSALLVEPGIDNFFAVEAMPINTKRFEKLKSTEYEVLEIVAPIIKRPTSICEITGLT